MVPTIHDPIMLPKGSTKTGWVELGVVMGKRAQYVWENQALEHVAGYVVVNDVADTTETTRITLRKCVYSPYPPGSAR